MSSQLRRTAIAASLIAISACAIEPADRAPPPFDVDGDGRLDVLVAAAIGVVLETRIQ